MRKLIVVFVGGLILVGINFVIYQREQLLVHGREVLLQLAPVDPRSLMQGDYMALRFKVVNDAFPGLSAKELEDGHLVITLDANGIGTFKRFADGSALAADEVLLRYRIRANQPKFATNAFFFQEGHAKYYERGRYGEFRVAADGEAILTALRDEHLAVLGPKGQ